MNIFGGRPGFAAGITAIIAILALSFFELSVSIALLAAAILALVLCIVLGACRYISPYRAIASALVILVFAASMLRGIAVFSREIPSAESFVGEGRYVHATVTERRTSFDYFTSYALRVESIDGEKCDLKALLDCNYSSELQKGYEFVLKNAKIISIDELGTEEKMSLMSEEIYIVIETSEPNDYAVISENGLTVLDRFDSLNSYLRAKLKNGIGGEEGRLASAMLLGDKYAVSSETRRDFSRSGLSHYLAVSGLHVSIITGIVSLLLMQLKIRKLYRNILMAVFAVGYLFLLGFPVSAVRSVAMLLIVFLAYSMGDNADPVNSLGIAAAGIVLVSPMSVFDVSFILSFTATLGVVCFVPLLTLIFNKLFRSERRKKHGFVLYTAKVLAFILGTLMTTASALTLTLLPTAYFFEEISVVGFGSNLAAALLGAPMLACTSLYLIFGGMPYIGGLLAEGVRIFAKCFLGIASRFGDIRGALLSLVSDNAWYMVLGFSIIVYIFLIVKIKRRKLLLLLPAAYPIVIAALMLTAGAARPQAPEATFTSRSGYDSILLACGDGVAMIDLTEGSLGSLRLMRDQARAAGYTETDMLILTHYHNDHIAAVSRFVLEEKVYRVLLPYPENEADAWIMLQISETAAAAGCRAEMIPQGSLELPGGVRFTLFDAVRIERSNHPVLYCSLSRGEETVTYIGESSWELEPRDELVTLTERSRALIYGLQGPVAKTFAPVPQGEGREYVFFSGLPIEVIIPASDLERIRNFAVFEAEEWKYVFSNQ